MEAIYPDGRVEMLSCVNNYKFGWHIVYNYADEVQPLLPAGTMLHVISWHNNTASNRYNPDPRNWAGFGQRSIDDMSFAWVNYVWLTDDDFKKQVAERKASQPRVGRPNSSSSRSRETPGVVAPGALFHGWHP